MLWLASCSAGPEAEEYTPRLVEAPGLTGKIWQVHNFYVGGQPTEADLQALRGRGLRTVINLRGPGEEAGFDVESAARGMGLEVVSIPVTPQALDPVTIDAFLGRARASRRQTLIHCDSGDRASALWAAYLGASHGLSAERALAVAEATGLKSEALRGAVREYLQDRQAARPAPGS